MVDYNPFNKNISDLERSDLDILIKKEVSEGWYVEYKSDFLSNNKIGHSIASFANTDGGWYIIGVDDEDDTNVARDICGFDLKKNREPKERIANIVKSHIKPTPFFESKLIKLEDNKGVLVVCIEKGDEAPYLTKNGTIYQRVGEVSNPEPITDPYTVHRLLDRSQHFKLEIENFCENKFSRTIPNSNNESCFLELYVYLKPRNFIFYNFESESFFNQLKNNFSNDVPLLHGKIHISHSMPFDTIYSSLNSYILRNTNTSLELVDLVPTIEIFKTGDFKFFSYLPNISTNGLSKNIDKLGNNNVWNRFLDMLSPKEKTFNYLSIIDGQSSTFLFTSVFNQYIRLLKTFNYNGKIGIRIRISDCSGHLLFFNDDGFLEFIKNNGIPIIQKSVIEIPEFKDGTLIELDLDIPNISIQMVVIIFNALGLPNHNKDIFANSIANFIIKNSKKEE